MMILLNSSIVSGTVPLHAVSLMYSKNFLAIFFDVRAALNDSRFSNIMMVCGSTVWITFSLLLKCTPPVLMMMFVPIFTAEASWPTISAGTDWLKNVVPIFILLLIVLPSIP
uniref:ORF84 n=1 Tax=Malaco herpesvirus 1 TaxID=3031797 RepID=A0AA48P8D3_9VIRU|nr:TPA_asm: ORF84 [Malaco herpesvirus 1]